MYVKSLLLALEQNSHTKHSQAIEIIENVEVKLNQWIRFRGSDLSQDEVVIRKGTQIEAAEIGLLAQLGIDKVMAFDTPRVGVLSTGNELVEMEKKEDLLPGT